MSKPYRVGRAISPAGRNHTSARLRRRAECELRAIARAWHPQPEVTQLRFGRRGGTRAGVRFGCGAIMYRRAAFGYVWPTLVDGNAVAAGSAPSRPHLYRTSGLV